MISGDVRSGRTSASSIPNTRLAIAVCTVGLTCLLVSSYFTPTYPENIEALFNSVDVVGGAETRELVSSQRRAEEFSGDGGGIFGRLSTETRTGTSTLLDLSPVACGSPGDAPNGRKCCRDANFHGWNAFENRCVRKDCSAVGSVRRRGSCCHAQRYRYEACCRSLPDYRWTGTKCKCASKECCMSKKRRGRTRQNCCARHLEGHLWRDGACVSESGDKNDGAAQPEPKWLPFGWATISTPSSRGRNGGSSAALASDRTKGTYQGVAVDIGTAATVGSTYAVSGWFKLESGAAASEEETVVISVLRRDGDAGAAPRYFKVGSSTATDAGWTEVEGLFALDDPPPAESIVELLLYFHGPRVGASFYFDDVSVVEIDPVNLLDNPGFEGGLTGWASYAGSTVSIQSGAKLNGAAAALVDDRTESYDGIKTDVLGKMSVGSSYAVSAWCKLASGAVDNAFLSITVRRVDGGEGEGEGTSYIAVGSRTQRVTDGGWAKVEGDFTFAAPARGGGAAVTEELALYFAGPDPGIAFYLDDVRVVPRGGWKANADASIERIRKRNAVVRVIASGGSSGAPVANARVDVRQVRRHFAFGGAINHRLKWDPPYRTFVKENFEWAVPVNEAKWYANEPSRGSVTYTDMDGMNDVCQAWDIKVRGHAVAWAVDENVQDWVKALNEEELRAALRSRVSSVVGRYRNKFVHWDVNNEMLHGTYFADRLGPSIRPWLFSEVKAVDPNVLTFVNDYGIITGPDMSAYKRQIRELQAAGAAIDGIGVQGHFGSSVDPYAVKSRLDSLAELGLPIWITEYDAENADPDLRADCLENLYRTAFAHPAVEGVLMWGFWAGTHWRGPDAAIVDLDWTPNAAGLRYRSLMGEWTTSLLGLTTDANGDASFRGYHGKYQVTVTVPGGTRPSVHEVYLSPGKDGVTGTATFTITADSRP